MEKYNLTASELANITGKSITAITKAFKDSSTKKGARVLLEKKAVKNYLLKQNHDYKFYYSVQVNLRGASTKSTTTSVIASRLSSLGYKTCILDIDPQASCSLALGYITKEDDNILVDVINQPKNLIPSLKKIEEGLYLLPSSLGNTIIDPLLASKPHEMGKAISNLVDELKENGFDAVLVDCPPSLGASVISAISSVALQSGTLLIPTVSDVFSLKGIQLLTEEAMKIWDTYKLQTPEIKILFNRYDGRERLSLEALSYLQKHPIYSKYLMPTIIKQCSDVSKTQKYGETVFAMSSKSQAKEDFDNVVLELTGLNNLKNDKNLISTFQQVEV